jgi:hypothetical protein
MLPGHEGRQASRRPPSNSPGYPPSRRPTAPESRGMQPVTVHCSTPRRYPSRGSATGATRSPTTGSRLPEPAHGTNHGEPVAWRHARRVRRAAWGNGPAAMPAPRPRPTQPWAPVGAVADCSNIPGSGTRSLESVEPAVLVVAVPLLAAIQPRNLVERLYRLS